MPIAVSNHAAVILENMKDWTVAPSLIAMNLDAMNMADQEKGSNTYRLYHASLRSSSTRPQQRRWVIDMNTVRKGTPRALPMFLTARYISNSAKKRLPQMESHTPTGISQIAEISHLGYLLTVLLHSNAEVIQHGQSFSSITTSPLTCELTSTTSSAMESSLAPNP